MANAAHSTRTISVDHVTIGSNKPFENVRAKLETLVPRIDDGIFTLLRYGESERALRELEASPPLSIFGQRDHGALLSIAGLRRRAIRYHIGNPLTASKMTRHQLSAGLYAPIRVLLREEWSRSNMIDRPPSSASSATMRSMPLRSSLIATYKRCLRQLRRNKCASSRGTGRNDAFRERS